MHWLLKFVANIIATFRRVHAACLGPIKGAEPRLSSVVAHNKALAAIAAFAEAPQPAAFEAHGAWQWTSM
jgi:hypothetical protein